MVIPNYAANGFAEMKLHRESKSCKYMGQMVKYWFRIICMDREDPVKRCYGWQKSNMRARSWTKEFKKDVCSIGLAFVGGSN
jgi:hypothetical protein